MATLINPNIAFLLIFAAVMLALQSILNPRSNNYKVLLVLCLVGAGLELTQLKPNPWALLITALSPLPFIILAGQERLNLPLMALTIVMLMVVSTVIFVDKDGHPLVNLGMVGMLTIFSSLYLLYAVRTRQNARNGRMNERTDSLIGVVGEASTEIDTLGTVRIEGELWLAKSDKAIPLGSMVRVIRCDGAVLFVKQVEKLTK